MKPRFIVDGMLGSLSRWLRICGYDTEYKKNAKDNDILEEAKNSARILVTRDKILASIAKRRGIHSHFVEGDSIQEKLRSVAERFSLSLYPEAERCSKCNGLIKPIDRKDIKTLIPPESLRAFDKFWLCVECNSVFWQGSHWKKIKETLDEVRRSIG